jgi:hypothetical protein
MLFDTVDADSIVLFPGSVSSTNVSMSLKSLGLVCQQPAGYGKAGLSGSGFPLAALWIWTLFAWLIVMGITREAVLETVLHAEMADGGRSAMACTGFQFCIIANNQPAPFYKAVRVSLF